MRARALTLAGHDVRLQYRYGIYGAYAFVIAFYVAAVVWGRPWLPDWAPALIIYTDPAAVGFFFLGALMMLEKSEGVRVALSVAPVSAADYLAGKFITLTGLAMVACGILAVVLNEGDAVLLVATAALTSLAFLGIGVPIALRFRTVNAYLVGSSAFLTPIIAPAFLALLPDLPLWATVLPPIAQFQLILVATGAQTAGAAEIAFMLAVCAIAAAGAVWFALVSLRREFGSR
jgi:fluoroquinolone transport system permease protein